MVKEFPDKSPSERISVLASRWNEMKEEEKEPYVNEALADKKVKAVQTEAYLKSLPPKKPLTAFLIFSNERREKIMKENPNDSISTYAKKLGPCGEHSQTNKKRPIQISQ